MKRFLELFPFIKPFDFSKFGDANRVFPNATDRHWVKAMLKQGAEWNICEWCGNLVPIYHPVYHQGYPHGRTSCKVCKRNCGGYGQLFREEYKDGCYHVVYKNGRECWVGGKHAPHNNFIKDSPIKILFPVISRECNQEVMDLET